jgi:CheY-like chemotaxis protein
VLSGAIELTKPLADRNQIELKDSPTPELYVLTDHQRLKQVLVNLISNGIKYNRPGGSVTVRAIAGRGDMVRLEVSDTGRGIDPESLPKLFTPFERLGMTEIEGSGLGLALSRTMIEGMGGRVGVHSELGSGSTFWVEVWAAEAPVAEAPEASQPGALDLRSYPARRRVLYIEDTLTNIQFVEAVLRKRPSVDLIPAMMGQLGVDLAREHRPDLILLDMHLPDLSGEEVLKRLREQEETRTVPVVVLTADATEATRTPAIEEQASGFITKPIGVQTLLDLVDGFAGQPVAR